MVSKSTLQEQAAEFGRARAEERELYLARQQHALQETELASAAQQQQRQLELEQAMARVAATAHQEAKEAQAQETKAAQLVTPVLPN